jgi:hypothetical protein
MSPRLPLAALAALTLLSGAAPAAACSVEDGYRVPTNFEMVEHADVILLGVVEQAAADVKGVDEPGMVVRPVEVLKGSPPAGRLKLFGMTATGRLAVKSDPGELEQAHPAAYIGGCIRYMFVPGSTLLLFLAQDVGELVPLARPFSRWAEDVPSPDSRWVKAVRLYIEAAALPEAERRAALERRRAELLARASDPDAPAIAADIARSLAGARRWSDIMRGEIQRLEARKKNSRRRR